MYRPFLILILLALAGCASQAELEARQNANIYAYVHKDDGKPKPPPVKMTVIKNTLACQQYDYLQRIDYLKRQGDPAAAQKLTNSFLLASMCVRLKKGTVVYAGRNESPFMYVRPKGSPLNMAVWLKVLK